jgi:hypothetical protein
MSKDQNDSQIGSTILMSSQGYADLIGGSDGNNLHWTTNVNTELPIKMAASGSGANIKPDTIPNFFKKVTMARKDALAISVMKNKKTYTWTWN